MKTHSILKTVTAGDLDALDHVNNVRYLQWVQDAAEAHWNSLSTEEQNQRYIWMVLSHHIEYKGQAFLDDRLEITTYVTRSSGVTSTRIVEIRDQETRKLIVKAETQWCLLSRESKRPARLTEELITLFQ